jgi:adenylosuccinate lyase
MLPEASILTDYILNLTIRLMEKLVFYPENIERNLNHTGGLIMAERFMAELTRRGMGRQTAYALVRKCALEAKKLRIGLKDVILQQDEIKDYLTPEEVEEIMDPHTYLGSSVQIVDNVLEESSRWF